MTIEIQRHAHIPKYMFVELISTFAAIDTVLSLHYSNHTTHITIDKVLESTTALLKRKITILDLEKILYIDSNSYSVSKDTINSNMLIKFPNNEKLVSITRKLEFINQVNKWIRDNPDQNQLGSIDISGVIKQNKLSCRSSNKIAKPNKENISPIKLRSRLFDDLKNDSSRFKFKAKEETSEQQKNNGMSLLERIRLKEKLKREQQEQEGNTCEIKYEKYLLQKVQMVYDVIYQLYNTHLESATTFKSFSLTKLSQIIVDSSSYPLDPKEIKDVINLIQKKLASQSESKFNIIDANGVQIVKISNLNRTRDLQVLH